MLNNSGYVMLIISDYSHIVQLIVIVVIGVINIGWIRYDDYLENGWLSRYKEHTLNASV